MSDVPGKMSAATFCSAPPVTREKSKQYKREPKTELDAEYGFLTPESSASKASTFSF